MTYTIYHIPGKKVGCTHDFERRKREYEEGSIIDILDLIPDELGDMFAGDVEHFYADWFGYKKGKHYAESNWNITQTKEQRSKAGQLGGKAAVGYLTTEVRKAAQKASIKTQLLKGTHNTQTGKTAFHTGVAQRASAASPNHPGKTGKSGFQTGVAGRASAVSLNHPSKTGRTGFHTGEAGRRVGELGISGFQTGKAGKASAASPNHMSKRISTCPHCGKVGRGPAMIRFHFDNCEFKCVENPTIVF